MATVAKTSTNSALMSETDASKTLVRTARELPPESDMFHAAACGARDWLSLTLKRARKPLNTDKHVKPFLFQSYNGGPMDTHSKNMNREVQIKQFPIGLTVLHIAAFHGHVDCLELLLEDQGCVDVNVSCPDGRRPVHMVLTTQSRPNTHTALRYLLEHGAHVNVSTDEGLTPLHLAAAEGLMDCTETLVRNGADIHAKDKRGHMPLDLARIWGHRVIARFLKDVMWRKDKKRQKKKHIDLRQELVMMQKSREKSVSVLDLPRLGRSGKLVDSPWTEVMLHLSEELKPGHY